MKILIIINGWTTKMSGGDYHILKVGKYWNKDHEVTYLLPRLGYEFSKGLLEGKVVLSNTFFEKEIQNPIIVILLYFLRTLKAIFSSPKEKFDVVIASSHFLCDVIPAFFIHFKDSTCKLVVFYHGLPATQSNALRRFIRKTNDFLFILLIKRFFQLVFVINPIIKEHLIKRGLNNKKVIITTNGVDEISVNAESKAKEFDACFLGRLVRSKGIFDLVEVWKNVTKELDAKLGIIGDGPDKETLMKKINAESLEDKILLLGHLDEKKYEIMIKSKIFLFPSYAESWGISIAEAMACGLPVITYDIPIYQFIFGSHVIPVTRGNVEQMAEKVIFLLKNDKLRIKSGEAGQNFVKKYNWRKIAKEEISFMQKVIK